MPQRGANAHAHRPARAASPQDVDPRRAGSPEAGVRVPLKGFGFRVPLRDLGFGVRVPLKGLGFRVPLRFRVSGFKGFGFGGLGVWDLGLRVWGRVEVYGSLPFRIQARHEQGLLFARFGQVIPLYSQTPKPRKNPKPSNPEPLNPYTPKPLTPEPLNKALNPSGRYRTLNPKTLTDPNKSQVP